jgi:hypothetical protein
MTNIDVLVRFPGDYYKTLQASSYNRASVKRGEPGWFADSDGVGFIRSETSHGQTEWVMMEHTGPGAITKMWTPYFYRDLNDHVGPNVRIYLDGSPVPVIDESFIRLLTAEGSIEYPFAAQTARAGDLYLPIPFARSCKVVMTKHPFYFIINYRAYKAGTRVESFTRKTYDSLSRMRSEVGRALTAELPFAGEVHELDVPANGHSEIPLPSGPKALRQFSVRIPEASTNGAVLRSTVIAMKFDGEETVWCPIGDFFSSADALHPFRTLQRTVESDGTMTCSWVMPFRRTGSIQILNCSTNSVRLKVGVECGPWKWDAASMHFHSNWRPDETVPGTPPSDWNFIDIKGQGVYVGDSWTVLNIQPGAWWGEGDEKIYIDSAWDEGFPTHFGTGSEDYYGWAGGLVPTRKDEFSHPFLSNVRVGGLDGRTLGYNINTRTRSLDAIPFSNRLRFDMESSFGTDIRNPWNLLGYSVTTFWYGKPGAVHNRPAAPTEAAKPISSLNDLTKIADSFRTRISVASPEKKTAR